MSELKTKINDAISEHIDIGNSYTYQLIRTKEAFQYGTVTLDDFIEWDDDAVEELSNDIMKALQPKLNENQEIVLEWLKREHFDSYIKSVLSNLYFYVNMTAIGDLENEEIQEMVNAYEELSQEAFAEVLQAFATWALDQC